MRPKRLCSICNSTNPADYELRYVLQAFNVWRCKQCDFMFASPLAEASKGSPAKQHLRNYEYLYRKAVKDYDQVIKLFPMDKNSKILDIGCSIGIFLKVISENGLTAYGLEINPQAAEIARRKYGLSVLVGNIDKAIEVWGEGTFDLITMWGVIEHLPDCSDFLSGATRLLKKQGVIVIQTPTEDALIRRLIHQLYSLGIINSDSFINSLYTNKVGGHTQCFSRRSITKLLFKHGFQVFRIDSSSYGLKWMLKKGPISNSVRKAAFLGVAIVHFISKLLHRQNHMTVYAVRRKSSSLWAEV